MFHTMHSYAPSERMEPLPPGYESIRKTFPTQPVEIGRTYQEVIISHRRSGELALNYGFPDLQAFCDDLPPEARVLDVGAGISTLGRDVAYRRPDVQWMSVDLSYDRREIREGLESDAPDNMEFIAADAMELTQVVDEQSFDRVFSFYLLRHIRLAGRKHGLEAAKQLLRTPKPDGKLKVGPVRAKYVNLPSHEGRQANALDVKVPRSPEELQQTAQLMNKAIAITPLGVRQRLINGFKFRLV